MARTYTERPSIGVYPLNGVGGHLHSYVCYFRRSMRTGPRSSNYSTTLELFNNSGTARDSYQTLHDIFKPLVSEEEKHYSSKGRGQEANVIQLNFPIDFVPALASN